VAVGLSRIQAEAVRSLKAADIPEKQAQAAMQKVIAATLRAIQLLDETAGAFEEELAKPGRSPDRQQWLTEQADELLRELQKATACIVATTLQQVKEDLLEQKSTPVQPGLGILIRETPPPTVLGISRSRSESPALDSGASGRFHHGLGSVWSVLSLDFCSPRQFSQQNLEV
jgi:hypothetical protein